MLQYLLSIIGILVLYQFNNTAFFAGVNEENPFSSVYPLSFEAEVCQSLKDQGRCFCDEGCFCGAFDDEMELLIG